MSDTLSDLTQELTPEHVRRRVEDWERRVNALYDTLESWLPAGCTGTRPRTVVMNEEIMQQYDIASTTLPVLEVSRGEKLCASVVPHGLWIIGANGRLDVRSEKGIFIIIDRSQAFEAPSWHMAPLADRTRFEPLTEDAFRAVL